MWFIALFFPPIYLLLKGRIIGGIINLAVCFIGLITIPFGIGFLFFIIAIMQSLMAYKQVESKKIINQQAEAIASKMAAQIQNNQFKVDNNQNKINEDSSFLKKVPIAPTSKFDQEKWNALLKYDTDIALIADKIRPFGQKWVDEFASSYLALNDKKYLSDIEQKITSAAKKEIEYKKQQELALAKAEAERREQIRIRDEEHREQLLKEKERRAQIQRERAKFWQDWFSRNKKIITISGFIIILIASIATFLRFRNLKIKEEQIRLARETAENLAQKFVKENLITCNSFSYLINPAMK